jgi:hypothetical protein
MPGNIINFFNSNFFVSLSTILTIGGAIYLYLRQKSEIKQQIARLLINDIRNAQSAMLQIKSSLVNNIIPEITVLPENNWKKHSYLFAKDLDQDDTETLNKFFSSVERISFIVTQANNMFIVGVTHRNSAIQNANIDIVRSAATYQIAQKKLAVFDSILGNNQVSTSAYIPSGFYTNLRIYLPTVPDILNSEAGRKLKTIAHLN